MLIKDLESVLGPTEYAVLASIRGFDGLNPFTPVAGLTKNGNYHILYLHDGSKLRFTSQDSLEPDRPECIDCTITHVCDGGCEFCYMNCTPDGYHATLLDAEPWDLLKQIEPYTELAINGNDLSHPDIDEFLRRMMKQKVFVNITVNQKHYLKNYKKLMDWQDRHMIRGIGVSYTGGNDPDLIRKLHAANGITVHVIAGLLTEEEYHFLAGNDLSILILGFKNLGRGNQYFEKHDKAIIENLKMLERALIKEVNTGQGHFKSIAFDGLSIEQLNVKTWLDDDSFNELYAGDEGAYTFYLDMVDMMYARSSIERTLMPVKDSITEMFKSIQTEPLRVKSAGIPRTANDERILVNG